MGLVQYFRAARILKAKRSKRLKGRPQWQDTVPDTKQARDTYAIAAKHESAFARAFLSVVRSLITPEIERDFKEAWKTGSPTAIINSIPYFEEDPDAETWEKFTDQLSAAYLTVIQEAGAAATRDLNKQFKTDMTFYALPPESETEEIVEKQHYKKYPEQRKAVNTVNNAIRDGRLERRPCEICGKASVEAHHDDYSKPLEVRWFCRKHHLKHHVDKRVAAKKKLEKQIGLKPRALVFSEEVQKSMADVRTAARGMTVDVNPYSIQWVNEHGLELVTQTITVQQKTVVTDIIIRAMEMGLRPTDALDSIKENIGLTNRDFWATIKRKQLHLDAGLSNERAEALTSKYREKLLTARANMIARTETVKAQAQGRQDAWKVAQDSGNLPEVQRRWITAPPSPDPNRPCEICLDLDGTVAKLGEPYESIVGPVMGPGDTHPG